MNPYPQLQVITLFHTKLVLVLRLQARRMFHYLNYSETV